MVWRSSPLAPERCTPSLALVWKALWAMALYELARILEELVGGNAQHETQDLWFFTGVTIPFVTPCKVSTRSWPMYS